MAALVHLVTEAEPDNPDRLVCGSMTGLGLSPHGLDQARRVGRYLGPRPVVAIWSSPLERALRTAEEIAARSGVPVRVDPGLTEWEVARRWQGHKWGAIPVRFPGELESYLSRPDTLEFVEETLADLADRIASVARRLDGEHPHGDVVIVSHPDPVQAGRLKLVGSHLTGLHHDKPSHGAVITLRPGPAWKVEAVWEPASAAGRGQRSDLRVVPAPSREPDPALA